MKERRQMTGGKRLPEYLRHFVTNCGCRGGGCYGDETYFDLCLDGSAQLMCCPTCAKQIEDHVLFADDYDPEPGTIWALIQSVLFEQYDNDPAFHAFCKQQEEENKQ